MSGEKTPIEGKCTLLCWSKYMPSEKYFQPSSVVGSVLLDVGIMTACSVVEVWSCPLIIGEEKRCRVSSRSEGCGVGGWECGTKSVCLSGSPVSTSSSDARESRCMSASCRKFEVL